MQTALFENDRKAFLPERFRIGCVLGLLLFGSRLATSKLFGNPILRESINRLVVISLLMARILVVNGLGDESIGYGSKFNGMRIHTAYTEGAKVVLLVLGIGVRVSSLYYVGRVEIYAFEYSLRKRLVILGLMRLVSSNDLIMMYLCREQQSLCRYVLASFRRGSAYSTEAGLKYFILGAFASGLLLYGSVLIYGSTGTLNFGERDRLLSIPGGEHMSRSVGMVMVIIALLFKLAAVPFHMQSPDVYEGAPSPSSMFFAVVPKVAVLSVLIHRCVGPFMAIIEVQQPMLLLVTVSSMILSVLASLYQRRLKRFLAYSGIGHVGQMRRGRTSGTIEGVQGVRIYVVIYSLTARMMQTVILNINVVTGDGEEQPVKYRTDLSGLSKSNGRLAMTMARGVFSMAGVPVMAGFFAKRFILLSVQGASLYLVGVIAVLTSVVGAYNYLRQIKIAYFDNRESIPMLGEVSEGSAVVMGVTRGMITFFILNPSPLLMRTHRMAVAFCG